MLIPTYEEVLLGTYARTVTFTEYVTIYLAIHVHLKV